MRLLALTAVAALVVPASAFGWTWPVTGPVLIPFSFDPAHPYAGGQHRGIDVGAAPGARVVAPAGGTVSFAGSVPGGGRTVTIETPDGYAVTLVHLGSFGVRRGAVVREGDDVGTVGPSGVPELQVPYVYLGIRRASDEQGYLDPLLFLPAPAPTPVDPPPETWGVPPPAPAPASQPPGGAAARPAPASVNPVVPAGSRTPVGSGSSRPRAHLRGRAVGADVRVLLRAHLSHRRAATPGQTEAPRSVRMRPRASNRRASSPGAKTPISTTEPAEHAVARRSLTATASPRARGGARRSRRWLPCSASSSCSAAWTS